MQAQQRTRRAGRTTWQGSALALAAVLVSACAGGGGDAGTPDGASGQALAAGTIAIRGQLLRADGSPAAGVPVEARAMTPAGLVSAASGFQIYLGRTGAGGVFVLPVAAADVIGAYGGRFFEVKLAPQGSGADAPVRVRVDVFVDGAGADVGTLRLWSGAVQADADVDAVRVDWRGLGQTAGLSATGYRVEVRDAAGQVSATGQVSGFANTYQAAGASVAQQASTASVTAYARIGAGARTAYIALRSEEVAVVPASGGVR